MLNIKGVVKFFRKNQDNLFFFLCLVLTCAIGFGIGRWSISKVEKTPSVLGESTKSDTLLEVKRVEDEYLYGRVLPENEIFVNKDVVQKDDQDEFKIEIAEEDEIQVVNKDNVAKIVLSGSAILGLACANNGDNENSEGESSKKSDGELESSDEDQKSETKDQEGKVSGKFVASKNSKTYHVPDCGSAKRIKEENKVWFQSKKEAEGSGRTPHSCVE